MRNVVRCALAGAMAMAVAQTLMAQQAATQPAAKPVDVPVSRVVLFSSGVGYFEHDGTVTGSVTADLRFETAQINDVLKSLVVFDHGGGSVKTITYPANDPVNRTLRSFQVNLSGDPSMADILKQIRGAAVSITAADDTITGTILGVEEKEKPVGQGSAEKAIKTWVVNIITDSGIRSVSLEDIRKLDIQDEKIKKEMNQALAALVQARDQSKKTVTVHFDGTAQRSVGMGYLVETPVWKTTYRLLLPDPASKNTADLQAWAIVENQTDNDWNNVSLSLVGGRPISFIQMLYQPLYVSRPVVQASILANIVPQTYDNGISYGGALPPGVVPSVPQLNLQNQTQGLFSNGGGGFGGGGGNIGGSGGQGLFTQQSPSRAGPAGAGIVAGDAEANAMADFTQGVSAIADATKIGEMFHYTVDKVSLPRQQSSMIPIVAEGVAVDRVSIYSPSVSTKYAMRGVRLYNKTGKYLLGGPVTVMDTLKEGHSYAGDAKIEDVPPGQSRLLSYALDQDVVIQVGHENSEEALLTGSVVKGVLWLKYRSQIEREYVLQNKGDSAKTMIIEHPLTEGFDLKEPKDLKEKTEKVYRFEIPLAAKEAEKKLDVVLERTRAESMELVNVQDVPLLFYIKQASIPAKVREVLQTVSAKRGAIADLERKIQLRNSERGQVLQEQANVRENIRALPANSKSQEDEIHKLTGYEEDLTSANKDIKDLQAALETARQELAKYLAETTVE